MADVDETDLYWSIDAMRENTSIFVHKPMWPAVSPDLNPLDHYVRSAIGRKICKSRHYNANSLIRPVNGTGSHICIGDIQSDPGNGLGPELKL